MAKKKQDLTPEERLAAALVPEEEWPYELPEGWKWVRLAGLAEIIMGQSPRGIDTTDDNSYTPLIGGAADIGENKLTPHKYTRKVTKLSQNGDLILCIRATLGRPVLSNGEYCLGRGVAGIRLLSGNVSWIKYYLIQSERYLYEHATGSTFLQVTGKVLSDMAVPFPSESVQQHLVARIESLFAKLDAAREKVQSVLDSHETRKAALLHDAFTGKLTAKWREEHGISLVNWQTRSLSDCGTWKGGGTPSKAHPDYWENGEIMWVTSKDMKSDKIQDTQMHITPLGVEQSSAIYSEKPAVLFVTRSGILRHTLPVALVNRPFTTNQDLKSLTPNENIDTQYLFFAAKAFSGQILKTCMKNGTTVESINTKKLMEFLLPIASMREQKVIAKMLRQLLNKEQRAQQAAEATLAAIDRMKQSILARAFRGEL